jgi:hypothetical protein
MELTPYPDLVPNFVDEYKALIGCLGPDPDDESIRDLLVKDSEWSVRGSAILVMLAREYGTFVLANALALAEAMEIEDGNAGL